MTASIEAAALLVVVLASPFEPPQAGEEYEVSRTYVSSGSSLGSSFSSKGRDDLVERVLSASASGLELEYDLPKDTTAEDRARQWFFPARVRRPVHGAMELLNEHELEARVDPWLKSAGLTRAACGRWNFTWTAFRIECDPRSVLTTISAFDLNGVDLREGALHRDADARSPARLVRDLTATQGVTYVAKAEIDPDRVRQDRAESDVAVGALVGPPVTMEAALQERATEMVSGTISTAFEADREGRILRRTKVTQYEVRKLDGSVEAGSRTEIVERRPVPELSTQN